MGGSSAEGVNGTKTPGVVSGGGNSYYYADWTPVLSVKGPGTSGSGSVKGYVSL